VHLRMDVEKKKCLELDRMMIHLKKCEELQFKIDELDDKIGLIEEKIEREETPRKKVRLKKSLEGWQDIMAHYTKTLRDLNANM